MELLSPPGLAGIAILGVAADEQDRVLGALRTPSGKPCRMRSGQPPMRAVLQLDGKVVDDVLLVMRPGNRLEMHVHGAPLVLDQLHRHFTVSVAPPSSPAERLLREALSPAQCALALEQLGFDFDRELEALRAALARDPQLAAASLAAARERSRVAMALVEPMRVVLVGQQNAGKSSLFNQLLFRERALTGDTPGLTRDAIAEVTTLLGYPYELVDTAGEGAVESELDELAIARGRAFRRGALLVLVVDGSVGPTASDRELLQGSALVVRTKTDLPQADWPGDVRCDLSVSNVSPGAGEEVAEGAEAGADRDGAQHVRTLLGRLLAERRDLPLTQPAVAPGRAVAVGEREPASAGAVGGFAALDESQRNRLFALDADCSGGNPSA